MKKSSFFILILLLLSTLTIYSEDEIETITITAELIEEPEEEHSTTIISEDEISALPGATTPELISNVMGVQLSKFGNDAQPSFVTIRGSSPEQVLVLLNGKKLNSSQGGGVDLSIIPPESIKSIEVIRGGDSAVYGASAFGGIINIITKDVVDSYITVKYDYDSDNSNDLSLNIYKDLDNSKISSNFNAKYSPYDDEDNSDITSGSAAISFETELDELILNIAGNLYAADKGVSGTTEYPTDSARMEEFQTTVNLGLVLNRLEWDLDYLYKYRNYTDPDNIYGEVDSTHDYQSISTLLSYQNFHFNAELSGSYDYLISDSFDEDYMDKKNLSFYLSPNIGWKLLKVIPSARLDYDLEDELLLSWSINLDYPLLSDRLTVTASTGSAYRQPSFNDLYWPETSYAVGNEDLENEYAIVTDLGMLFQISDNFTLNTTLYYHYVTNLIQWTQGSSGVWSPDNIGEAEIKGIETELSYILDFLPIWGYLEGRLNYTYLSALNKESGVLYDNQLIYKPKHKANLIVIYYSDYDFTFSVDFSYTGERYITAANTKTADAYFLLDMNFTKDIINNLVFTLYGKNILNEEYEDYRGYEVSDITIGASLEYRF